MPREEFGQGPSSPILRRRRPVGHRRGALGLLACVATLAVLLAGTALAQEVRRGGVLVESSTLATTTLDPQLSGARGNSWYSMIFDTFFSYLPAEGDPDRYEVGPALATGFQADGNELVITLRQDVTFHDGSAWNASVAKWNLERARDHASSAVATTVGGILDIVEVDEYTLRLVLDAPQPLLPLQLTASNAATIHVVSQQAVEAMGDEAFARAPVGSGPFRFVEWVPDDRIVFERFDGHWELGLDGQPLPYLDGYVVRQISDQSVASIELRTGNIHLVFDPLAQDLAAIEAEPSTALHQVAGTYRGFPSFYFNSSEDSSSPFAHDVRLRQAVQHAIDREAMAAALSFGTGVGHYYWGWYPGVPGYDETLPRYEYDPERARALVAEAGYANGVGFDVKVINRPSDVRPLEVMQAMLAEVGIRMNIVLQDRVPWVEDGTNGNFEALAHGNTAQPDPMLRQESRTGSSSNWAGYSNPVVDMLWAAAATEADEESRAQLYRDMQRQIFEDAYHLVGYRFPLMSGHAANLRGLGALHNFRYLWFD